MRFSRVNMPKLMQDRVASFLSTAALGLMAIVALPAAAWSQGETTAAVPAGGDANTIANGVIEA